ncbi:glycosyltransferase family 4 protein [Psychroserpens sp.]|uniref:glycosyltransferase family 4 protein n=1 Tax=Psychroserpens sp. TaxID=2020870 RepID=UPI001B18963A|nr:glycosyltransferase family 4 protein [Psychroserpens sp.]MBO6605396.1 glycosyltransferase family 4 protein [Psychroserpens sp.]MBO6630172.1 glycosyltransferase family 4 protein [Psychroserpens sp.]MBO6653795.1 glycosyltransferase family 4 protein [Psychroserpens sp.]MBO6682116.1 glycosyltransferase family 4 protein [Psychroserpens sp.]MBO6748770.1 glycosyltransferase family 4 protein [Psychroserpens sp.]
MKQKVLVNTPDLSQGGGVSHYLNNLSLNESSDIDYFQIQGTGKSIFAKVLYLCRRYVQFSRKIKSYDLIHIHPSLNKNSFLRDAVFIRIAIKKKKNVLITMHGWEDEFESKIKASKLYRYIFKKTYARVAHYVVLGNIFKNKLIELTGSDNTQYFIEYTVIDDVKIKMPVKSITTTDPVKFLFLSRVEKTKGIYIAIDAIWMLNKKTGMNHKLIIAGDGNELESVKTYVSDNNLSFVDIKGFIHGDDKIQAFMNSDVFIFPTYYGEGLPTAILESMLYGLPVISRVIAAIPEVVKNGVNGYLLESKAPNDFMNAIEELIKSPDQFSSISELNQKTAKQLFVAPKARQRMKEIYQKLLND